MDGQQLATIAVDVVPRLARLTTRILEDDLDPSMTVRQFRVLTRLREDPRAVGALATGSGVRLPSMSQTVDSLAARGWVDRTEDPADRRRKVVRLTATGREALDAAEDAVVAGLAVLLDGLDDAEQHALGTGLGALERELDGRWERLVEGRRG